MSRKRAKQGRRRSTARRIPGLSPPAAQPAFLFEEFSGGPPHAPPRLSSGSFERGEIAQVQKLYLLFKTAQGFARSRVAKELEISPSSAKRILQQAREDPELFHLWGFVTRWRTDAAAKYFCRFCAWIESSLPEAVHHAHGHIWDPKELEVAPRGI